MMAITVKSSIKVKPRAAAWQDAGGLLVWRKNFMVFPKALVGEKLTFIYSITSDCQMIHEQQVVDVWLRARADNRVAASLALRVALVDGSSRQRESKQNSRSGLG